MIKLKLYTVLFVMVSLLLSNCGNSTGDESDGTAIGVNESKNPLGFAKEFEKAIGFDPNGPIEIPITMTYPLDMFAAAKNPYTTRAPQTVPFNVSRSVLTIREYLDYDNDLTKLGSPSSFDFIGNFSFNESATPPFKWVRGNSGQPMDYIFIFLRCNPATDGGRRFQLKVRFYDSADNEIGTGVPSENYNSLICPRLFNEIGEVPFLNVYKK